MKIQITRKSDQLFDSAISLYMSLLSELKMKMFLDLPNEIIVYLFTFLSEKDCMALLLSGVCDRISQLCAEKR